MQLRWPTVSHRTFVIGLLALFVAVSVQYSLKALSPRNGAQTRSAIQRWREQLLQLDAGENIYTRFTYPNPPIMAIMLRPIAEMPPLAGALTWFYAKVAMALLAFAAMFRIVESADFPFPPWARALTVVLSLRPIIGDLSHGNINLFILFLVVGCLFAYSRRYDVTAGVVLALAIACKVTPALMVGYFLWKGAWRVLIGCAIGLGLFFWLVPAAFLGWEQNAELLSSWVRQMITPFLVGGVVTSEHPNQSLPGLITRLLTESPSFSTYVNDVYTPVEFHNLLAIDPRIAGWIVKAFMGTFVAVVMWSCRTPRVERQGWRFAAEAGIVVIGMLLFSERTWKHHCVTLLIPFAVIMYVLAVVRLSARARGALIAVLATTQVLIAVTSTTLLPDAAAKLAQVYGAYTIAFVLLIGTQATLLAADRSARASTTSAGTFPSSTARAA